MKKRSKGKTAKQLALLALVFVIVLLAGCGSSSDNNSAADTSAGFTSNNAFRNSMNEEAAAAEQDVAPSEALADSGGANVAVTTGESSGAMPNSASTPQLGEPGNTALIALDRKLIYQAHVAVEVEDYGKAQTELSNLVALSGGYMLDFSDSRSSYEIGGRFVIKVPANGFQSFLTGLEKLKKEDEFERSVRGQDVTEEYADLEARLKAKQVVEARLLAFMEKATETKDLLEFSNELAGVQEEIERLKGRMRYIDQNVAYSTIELRMYEVIDQAQKLEKEKDRNALERAWQALKNSTKGVVAFFEGLFIVAAGALPVLIIVAIIAIPFVGIYRSNRRKNTHKFEKKTEESQPIDSDEEK